MAPKAQKAPKLEMKDEELDNILGVYDGEDGDDGDDFPEEIAGKAKVVSTKTIEDDAPSADTFRKVAARKSSLRSTESRATTWLPPSHLPDAPHLPGWRHRWCRYIAGKDADDINMSTRMREGYEPCQRKDPAYAEIVGSLGYGFRADNTDLIMSGGHVLCRIPEEVAEGRAEYYQHQALSQLKSTKKKAETLGDGETRIKMSVDEFKTRVSKNPFE
jgi:hypothetical protein